MALFQDAAEYYQNRQYTEAYQIYSAMSDCHAVFNTAMMEIFGRGIPQDLKKAEGRLQELYQGGMEEAAEPLAALQEYFKYAEIYNQYKREYITKKDTASAYGLQRAKNHAAEAVARLKAVPMFTEPFEKEAEKPAAVVLSEEEKKEIFDLLDAVYEDGQEDDLPKMLAVMQKGGFTKERFGIKSLTKILPQLPFVKYANNKAVFVKDGTGTAPAAASKEQDVVVSEADKQQILQLLKEAYGESGDDKLPKMLAVMQKGGFTKEYFGIKSLTKILPQLPFIKTELNHGWFTASAADSEYQEPEQPAEEVTETVQPVEEATENVKPAEATTVIEESVEETAETERPVEEAAGEQPVEETAEEQTTEEMKEAEQPAVDVNEAEQSADDSKVTVEPSSVKIYRYARLGKDADDRMFLNATDGNVYTLVKKNVNPQFLEALAQGEYRWIRANEGAFFVKPARANVAFLASEAEGFMRSYKKGDQISVPLKKRLGEYSLVSLGPTLYGKLGRDDVNVDYNSLQEGEIYTFEVKHCHMDEQKHFYATLKLIGKYDSHGTLRRIESLPDPEELRQTMLVPGKLVDHLKKEDDKRTALETAMGEELSINSLKEFILERYSEQKESHQIYTTRRGERYEIDVELNVRDGKGVPLKACLNKTPGHDTFVLALVGASSPDKEMLRQVFVGDWNKVTQELSELALPENWDYKDDKSRSKRILINYLKYSFYKARLDGDVYEEDGYGVFNTGLVDRAYDPIYCLLEPNRDINDVFERKWTIAYFACRGKGDNGKDLNRRISRYPNPPKYIKPEKAADLFFNTEKELYCDYEHILLDNMARLPREFIEYQLSYDAELKKMYREEKPFGQIRKYIVSSDRLMRDLEDGLKRAVDTAVKYASWNYKTAVPIYYPRNNSLSLLLPLNLVGDKPEADAALVIEQLANGNYQGQTILTMAMAYQDARQITRPNSDWLQLEQVQEDKESEDASEAAESF